jgi:hypothetical protein
MKDDDSVLTCEPSTDSFRTTLAILCPLCVGALWLSLWYHLKQAGMSILGDAIISFIPFLVGVTAGWVARLCAGGGTCRLGWFAFSVTLLTGIAGLAMQHKIEVDYHLQGMADRAYDETLAYAKQTTNIHDPETFRRLISKSGVSVIDRLVLRQKPETAEDFWFKRNFTHLHWVASRSIVIYGQGGPERTILEASRVMTNNLFFDQVVTAYAEEPITDAEISEQFTWEQPFLKKLVAGQISRDSFETPLIKTVWENIRWDRLIYAGFGPFLGMSIFWGCFAAHKIGSRSGEAEVNC